jgi:hypothetical protein
MRRPRSSLLQERANETNRLAVARHMPVDPPVTTASLPSTLNAKASLLCCLKMLCRYGLRWRGRRSLLWRLSPSRIETCPARAAFTSWLSRLAANSSVLWISKSRSIQFMAAPLVCSIGIVSRSIFQQQSGCQNAIQRTLLTSSGLWNCDRWEM